MKKKKQARRRRATGKRILLVDASDRMTDVIAERLEKNGFEVRITDGHDVERALGAERPDVIVIDPQNMVSDGLEICRTIKSVKNYASIPVIVFTTPGEREYETRCIQAGAVGVIYKPTLSELFELMTKVLRGEIIDWAEYQNPPE